MAQISQRVTQTGAFIILLKLYFVFSLLCCIVISTTLITVVNIFMLLCVKHFAYTVQLCYWDNYVSTATRSQMKLASTESMEQIWSLHAAAKLWDVQSVEKYLSWRLNTNQWNLRELPMLLELNAQESAHDINSPAFCNTSGSEDL